MPQSKILARLGAYIIDIFIVAFVIFIISQILSNIVKMPELTSDVISTMPTDVRAVYDSLISKNADATITDLYIEISHSSTETASSFVKWLGSDDILSYTKELNSAMLKIVWTEVISVILIFTLYFAILPYFWDKQTVGRLILKVKVVREIDDEKPTLMNFIVRDVVGSCLLKVINVCCGLHFILNIIFVLSKNKTIGDMISGTYLVSTNSNEVIEDNENNPQENNFIPREKVKDEDIEIVIDDNE